MLIKDEQGNSHHVCDIHPISGICTSWDCPVKQAEAEASIKNGAVGAVAGNTKTATATKKKRINPSNYWCFTLNNYTDDILVQMEHCFALHQCNAVVGKEIGESGTPHLQGYVEFKARSRPLEKFKDWAKKAHWEKRKGKRMQAAIYCSKDGDYKEYGDIHIPLPLAKITYEDLRPSQQRIADMFREAEDPKWGRKIYWFWEPTGNWGKSVLATYLVDQCRAIEVSGKAADAKCGIAAYVDTHGEGPPIVIMDIPRTRSTSYVSYEAIESIKNGRFFSSKYESGMVRFNKPHVIVFANEPPFMERMSLDRWCIEKLSQEAAELW